MIINDAPQGSQEWLDARLGIPTASNFQKILTSKGERSKQRNDYLYKLAGERITGEVPQNFQTADMARGHIQEPMARSLYEMMHGVKVDQVGLCFPNKRKYYGCSPDGLVNEDGGVEIKSAAPHIQAKRLHKGWKGTEHKLQVLGCMLVTNRDYWDLMSYCPGFKPIIVRFGKDDRFLRMLDVELTAFTLELDEIVESIDES